MLNVFYSILESDGLRQHVTVATHKFGHTLDVVISMGRSYTTAGVPPLYDPNAGKKCNLLGDHMAVMFLINMKKTIPSCRKITYRKYIDIYIPEITSN